MLDKARAVGVYDELVQGDLVEHLQTTAKYHDLVLAADVFIYVGELAPVFAALQRVVAPGGVFCFSAEAAGDGVATFELRPSLRYAHAEPYLRQLAADHGFEVAALHAGTIRSDQRERVDGCYVFCVRFQAS